MTEKVVGWGISHHLQKMTEPVLRNNKLLIDAERSVSESFFCVSGLRILVAYHCLYQIGWTTQVS